MATRTFVITVDDETASWLSRNAAAQGVTVSSFVEVLLRAEMDRADEYERAMADFFAIPPFLNIQGPLPTRDELHTRSTRYE